MAIGMTYEQYWYGDPLMVRAFYKANELKREKADQEAWLNGLYMMSAINATVCNMFRKSGTAPSEYPSEPYSMQKKREKEELEDQAKKDQEATFALAWMSSFVQAGKNWGNKKG